MQRISPEFWCISSSERLDKFCVLRVSEEKMKNGISSSVFLRFNKRLEQALSVCKEAALLLTPVLELIAQMSGLRFRLVGGPFMS